MRHHPIGRSTLWRVGSALAVAGVFASCSSRSADDGSSQSSSATLSTTTLPTVPPTTPTQSSDKRTAFEPVAGSRGIGDVLFADLGNPGLDVTHYEVDIAYAPDTGVLAGTVTLSITATEGLAGFSLDAVGLSIGSVSVNGRKARFVVDEPELVITPAVPIADGASFETTVVYTAMPHPQPSATGIPNGWFSTPNGTFVVNEPDGARTWLPSNDHPSDKATYRFTVHVRAGLTGIANGVLESHSVNITDDTWIWNQIDPMATYLIQVITGDYDIIHAVGPHSLVLTSVVHSADRVLMAPFVDGIADQISFFEQYFGPFPLASYGIAITDSPSGAAMEEQGRSLFSRDDFVSGQLGGFEQLLLSHELAHQWFGDAVTPASWQDIWLSESFATYGEWMWLDHIGQTSIGTQVDKALLGRQRSSVSTAKPLVESMFDFEVYDGGAVVLHALRLTIGDAAFFALLRTWVVENSGTSRGTDDFIALAERIAGIDLTEFFADWLFARALPDRLPT